MKRIYLDDVRTPIEKDWIVVRNFDEFKIKVREEGLGNIGLISLDHDLGDTAIKEYFNNVSPNFQLNYDNITEKTGYDCAKWLVDIFYGQFPERVHMARSAKTKSNLQGFTFPTVVVHSANPIGSANIMGYINNFYMNEDRPQTCVRVRIEHT